MHNSISMLTTVHDSWIMLIYIHEESSSGLCVIWSESHYLGFSVIYSSLSQILDQTAQISLRLINTRIQFKTQSDVMILTLSTNSLSSFFTKLLKYKGLTSVTYLRQLPKALLLCYNPDLSKIYYCVMLVLLAIMSFLFGWRQGCCSG